jgi:ribonuclease I
MDESKQTGSRGCRRFGFCIHGLWSGSPPDTQGRSPVRESRTPGSVRGYPVTGIPTATIILSAALFASLFHIEIAKGSAARAKTGRGCRKKSRAR